MVSISQCFTIQQGVTQSEEQADKGTNIRTKGQFFVYFRIRNKNYTKDICHNKYNKW